MENFYLSDLVSAVNGSFIIGDPHLPIGDIELDTRKIRKNSVFFALKGKNFDGHDFINEAIEKEVSAIIYSKEDIQIQQNYQKIPALVKVKDTLFALEQLAIEYRKKNKDITRIAITGSNGKTTTKEMLYSILSQKAKTLCNQGNFNNNIGVPLTIFNLTSDTKYGIFEIGTSNFGEIRNLANIVEPHCGIITNIGNSHLEFFKTPENVLKEKTDLIKFIDSNGFICINNDNPYLKNYKSNITKKTITFSLYGGSDVYAKNLKLWLDKPVFDLYVDDKCETVELNMKGKFNIINALGASAIAYGLGFSIAEIKNGLEKFSSPNMRMQTFTLSTGTIIINDAYNANPSSMQESISSLLQSYPDKSIILVLSDMLELGENSSEYHAQLGKYINSLQKIQSVYLTGDQIINTKNEINNKDVRFFIGKHMLLEELEKNCLTQDNVIFIKASRGMKMNMIFDELVSLDKIKNKNKV